MELIFESRINLNVMFIGGHVLHFGVSDMPALT